MAGEIRSLVLDAPVDAAAFQFLEDESRFEAHLETVFPGGNRPFEWGVRVVFSPFQPVFAATPGEGWRSQGTVDGLVGLIRGPEWEVGTDGAGVWVTQPTAVTDVASGRDVPLAPGPDAVLDWLRSHPYLEVGEVEPARVGSLAAMSLSFKAFVPDEFETPCQPPSPSEPVMPTCQRWFKTGKGHVNYGFIDPLTQYEAGAIVLDVSGTTIMVLTVAYGPDMEAHLKAVDALLASIEFLE
jgi:hypothetical protein